MELMFWVADLHQNQTYVQHKKREKQQTFATPTLRDAGVGARALLNWSILQKMLKENGVMLSQTSAKLTKIVRN